MPFLRLLSLLLMLVLIQGCSTLPSATIYTDAAHPVPRFEVFEVTFHSTTRYANPYADVRVQVIFTAPDGRELRALAFHDGDDIWRARVAPDAIGEWRYRTTASNTADAGLQGITGQFKCVTSPNKGFIKPSVGSKYWFSFSDGSPFYGVGDTSYGLTTGITDRQMTDYLQRRHAQGFNYVRFFASGNPFGRHKTLSVEDSWPWGGTPEAPDYDRINPRYFHRLQSTLQRLKQRDMYAEVLVFNYYWMPFIDPVAWTPARERLWAEQVVARLAANPAVFLWTVTNEYETYPDGKYRYDGASDDEWPIRIGTMLHDLDPHGHPTTVHNFKRDAGGGTGERFGNSAAIDVLSQQNWGQAEWNGTYRDGDASGIDTAIAADRKFDKPVINSENGYEWLRDYSNFSEQGNGTDKARRSAWRTFVGGGAAYAAGFAGTWAGSDEYMWREEGPIHFTLRDMGLGEQIKHLRSFVDTVPFARMAPADQLVNAPNLCLASPGLDYVVYVPQGGAVTVDLAGMAGQLFSVSWFDPRSGKLKRYPALAGGTTVSLDSPGHDDWVLRLRRR